MATVKFGAGQLSKPTPASWSNGIQIYTVVASVFIAWVGTADFIGIHAASVTQSILGLTLGLANGLKPFLGVNTTQKQVPIDEVSEMEVKK